MLTNYAVIEQMLLVNFNLAQLQVHIIRQWLIFLLYLAPFPFFPCSCNTQRYKHVAVMNQIYLMRKATVFEIPSLSCRTWKVQTEWGRALGNRNSWLSKWTLYSKANPCLHRQHPDVILDKSLKPTFHNWSLAAYWYPTWITGFSFAKDVATSVAEVLWTYGIL